VYLAHYCMNLSTEATRARFLNKVERATTRFCCTRAVPATSCEHGGAKARSTQPLPCYGRELVGPLP
jgi:hypothetical protein